MIHDENYWAIPPDLEAYALEHPMIPLSEAVRETDAVNTRQTAERRRNRTASQLETAVKLNLCSAKRN